MRRRARLAKRKNARKIDESEILDRPYPFTPPAVSPPDIKRSTHAKMIIMGMAVSKEPAIISPHANTCAPNSALSPIINVQFSGECKKVVVNRKLFQEIIKTKAKEAIIAGTDNGTTIRKIILNTPRPSIIADSSIESGIVLKYAVRENSVAGNVVTTHAKGIIS